jgi:hypothetical protein
MVLFSSEKREVRALLDEHICTLVVCACPDIHAIDVRRAGILN